MMSFFHSSNIDLFALGIATSALILMGMVTYLEDRKSATARALLIFAFATMSWNLTNFFQYQFGDYDVTLLALRINLLAAVWHAYAFFSFAYVFPKKQITMPWWDHWIILPVVIVLVMMTQTPLIFSGVDMPDFAGQIPHAIQGPFIGLFGIVTFGLLILGLICMVFHRRQSADAVERRQMLFAFAGMSATAVLIVFLDLILPLSFDTVTFLPYAGVFMFPFVGLMVYTIYRHRLFNPKAILAQTLTFILGALTFVEVMITDDPSLLVFRSALLAILIAVGIALTRSVIREVEQRETIEKQAHELRISNVQQEKLLHFVSHEVKGYLTKAQAVFANIVEGDYTDNEKDLKRLSEQVLAEMRQGVATVKDILDASSLRSGRVIYTMKSFDVRKAVQKVVEELQPHAKEKGLILDVAIGSTPFIFHGDEEKIRQHLIRNLIDNAIRYTPKGTVTVELVHARDSIRFAVEDHGVGISAEDMERLFTAGGRGIHSDAVNPESTGFGLFIAKQVTEAHGGKIWAESDGVGKGAKFVVEFPTS